MATLTSELQPIGKANRRDRQTAVREKKRVFIKDHIFEAHVNKHPTVCPHCSHFIYGLRKSGYLCRQCGYTLHKHCAELVSFYCPSHRNAIEGGYPHHFKPHNHKKPTSCGHCGQFIQVLHGQQCSASLCKMNVHTRCMNHLPHDCSTFSNKKYGMVNLSILVSPGNKEKIKLRINLKRACKLLPADLNGFSDPYVKTKVIDNKGVTVCKHKTKVHFKTLDPVFETEYELNFVPHRTYRLHLHVYDWDNRFSSDYLGGMSFNMDEVEAYGTGEDLWFTLLNKRLTPFINQKVTIGEGNHSQIELEEKMENARMRFRSSVDKTVEGVLVGINEFRLNQVIGQGTFGKVIKVSYNLNKEESYALKVMRKDKLVECDAVECVKAEQKVLAMPGKPSFLTDLKASFQDEENIYIVMDYMSGGDLWTHLDNKKHFSEQRTQLYLAELSLGLFFLHGKGIIYRDIKPENILIDREGHLKLADFGLCKEGIWNGQTTTGTFCGTLDYMAPEVIIRKQYDCAVDLWSMGVLVYEMLYGDIPFSGDNEEEQLKKILKGLPTFPPTISCNGASLISKLLILNPIERIGYSPTEGVTQFRSHPFFDGLDWDSVEDRQIIPEHMPESNSEHFNELREVKIKLTNIEKDNLLLIDQDQFKGFDYTCDGFQCKKTNSLLRECPSQ